MPLIGMQYSVDDDAPASELPDEAFGRMPATPPLPDGDDCPRCGGSGEIHRFDNPRDPQTQQDAPCPECTCWNCGGSGIRCCEYGADR